MGGRGGSSGIGAGGDLRGEMNHSHFTDNSVYEKEHNEIVSFVKKQIGIDLNKHRDGDGTSPSTTTYWDLNGPKVAIDIKRMSNADRNKLMQLTTKPYGINVEQGGAWIAYVSRKKRKK